VFDGSLSCGTQFSLKLNGTTGSVSLFAALVWALNRGGSLRSSRLFSSDECLYPCIESENLREVGDHNLGDGGVDART
jgi:hypothetical protein